MAWETINLKLVAPTALSEIATIVNTLKSDLAPIIGSNYPPTFGGVIGGLISIMNTIGALFTEKEDLIAQFEKVLIPQVQNIVNDVFNTNVSMLLVLPKAGKYTLSPVNAISEAVNSLNDLGDLNRPQISSTGFATGIGVLITALNLSGFQSILNNFRQLISTKDIESLYNRVTKQVEILQIPKSPVRTVSPTPPVWQSLTFPKIFPVLQNVQNVINSFLQELQGGATLTTTSVQNLTTIIEAKFTQLYSLMTNVTSQIESIANIPTQSGIYVLTFEGVGGNNLIRSELQSLNLNTLSQNQYSLFVLFVGGSTSVTAFETLGELMGI